MSRFSRINTIWRKELTDTLRDRRTLIAMILVPMALYPAMILGSLQGFELQISRLKQEEYRVVVQSEEIALWLRHLIDTDLTRRPGVESETPTEELVEMDERGELPAEDTTELMTREESATERAQADVRQQPPDYYVDVIRDPEILRQAVTEGSARVGLLVTDELPSAESEQSTRIKVLLDQTEIRSQIAAAGLESILERAGDALLRQRLERENLELEFITPIAIIEETTASPEKVGGSILGQIVPLILIVMTITGAIYPAIDLTAGERERGTLETLMVAPVPTVDLIAGKFIVVALIGMLSAALNLLSIGGTVFLGGLGDVLSQGGEVVIPLGALPWVLLLLIPLAVMFSAMLLAVCSFARSFKEAQNYVMPVMVAALIPAVVGILPGTRLEGPMLIMPVTNIVILTRDLFTGQFEVAAIIWVTMSTTLYAGAAVAVAARLFGQEAVLFADSGSVKTLFKRRFFKPADRPAAAQAFLMLALGFSLNFFAQQYLLKTPGGVGTIWFWLGLAGIMMVLFVLLPFGAAAYLRVRIPSAFSLSPPPLRALIAAVCFGLSTWILASAWFAFQSTWLPLPAEMAAEFEKIDAVLGEMNLFSVIVFLALVPAVCEELFFRGYALSGLRGGLGKAAAVLVVALAFGIHHHSIFRLIITAGLGVLFGLLVIQYRSIWPAILAHLMHNGIAVLSGRADGLQPLLARLGYVVAENEAPPALWIIAAAVLTTIGILLCLMAPRPQAEITLESDGPPSRE
ncbi:MAG: CPBP family intramembrane metalloprotease [Phycisphaerae bacterium]|nr:CPBP family intramembrane metalloprotease [Phycisphaerae bacterium]